MNKILASDKLINDKLGIGSTIDGNLLRYLELEEMDLIFLKVKSTNNKNSL